MIPFFIKQFQEPLESTGLMKVLQVFYQVEFRAFLAVLISFGLVLAFGPRTIRWLVRQKVGDAPEFHNADVNELMRSRAGTPTMGGLMMLTGFLTATLLWADLRNLYVWTVLLVTLGFGAIGFYDDYLKVTKQSDKGFSGRRRLFFEFVIAGVAVAVHERYCLRKHDRGHLARDKLLPKCSQRSGS